MIIYFGMMLTDAKSVTILLTTLILFSTQISASIAQGTTQTSSYQFEIDESIISLIDLSNNESHIEHSFIQNSDTDEKAKLFYKNQSFSISVTGFPVSMHRVQRQGRLLRAGKI